MLYRINDENEDNFAKFKKVSLEILDRFPAAEKTKFTSNKEVLNHADLINKRFGRIPECYKSAVESLSVSSSAHHLNFN